MSTSHSLDGLTKWLNRPPWDDHFEDLFERHVGPACLAAGLEVEDLGAIIDDALAAMLWGCIFEDLLSRDDAEDGNIVDDYLKRRGWKEKAPTKNYMTGLRHSVLSIFEISDIQLGKSFLARDLFRGGEPLRVSERSGTHYLKPWDRVAARVVVARAKIVMGGGILVLDRDLSEEILDTLESVAQRARKEGPALLEKLDVELTEDELADIASRDDVLRYAAPTIVNFWLDDLLEKTLRPQLPELSNSDGEQLEFLTLHYVLLPGTEREDLCRALARVPDLEPVSDTDWRWRETPAPGRLQLPVTCTGVSLHTESLDGSLLLGDLELQEKTLVFMVNSEKRAERGKALLAPFLEGLTREPLVERQTIEQLMAAQNREEEKDGEKGEPSGSLLDLTPDERRRIVHEMLDRHYSQQLDQAVPLLGDVSPRAAVATVEGRLEVVEWLKLLENHNARQKPGEPMGDYDLSWMWDELGVAPLRK